MRKKLQNRPFVRQAEVRELNPAPASVPSLPKPVGEQTVRLISERAAGLRTAGSFGVAVDVERVGFESLLPALVKAEIPDTQPKVKIGSSLCGQPYEASMLNGSALSFGPMGKNFILAVNKAAKMGEFFQNTGEAGISPYHFNVDVDLEAPDFSIDEFFDGLHRGRYPEAKDAGDVVWQLGNGYFGCRREDGSFDPEQFRKKATVPNVRMIEVKLSQGVEPRKEIPMPQVTPGLAKVMGVRRGRQAVLKPGHSAFLSPLELLQFTDQLRSLSDGKPVGLKIGVSHRHYFLAICKAMLRTGIVIDFVTVDGMEAGTAAGSLGSMGFTGTSLNDSVLFVHNALVGTNLREQVKIIASGKMFTEQEMISILARGADLCATARGIMISVGCDQQQECYKGTCPRGIATQNSELLKQFNIRENAMRVFHYHRITILELMELLSIAGVTHPDQIRPFHIQKRISPSEVKTLDEIYEFIEPGSLLSPFVWFIPQGYRKCWQIARPEEPFDRSLEKRLNATGQPKWK